MKYGASNRVDPVFQMDPEDTSIYVDFRADGSVLAGFTNYILEIKAINETIETNQNNEEGLGMKGIHLSRMIGELKKFYEDWVIKNLPYTHVGSTEGSKLLTPKSIKETIGLKHIKEITQDQVRKDYRNGYGLLMFQLYAGIMEEVEIE